ncbi:MAG: hypothetical protein KDE34_06750 [Anaerolineales bacterium]|nr:hypothetical protein [Anaerolineales bacterium]
MTITAGPNRERFLYLAIFAVGFCWTLYIGLASAGVPVHDELAHYFISRDAWQQPELLLSMWGRPVRNIVYWLPAIGGLKAARVFSVILTGLTIGIATEIGRLIGVQRLYLIPLFIWFQPWVSAISFAVLPQIPFALILAGGVLLALKKKDGAASIAFGLLPLTRHEGLALLGLWLLYLFWKRSWRNVALAFLPLLLFNLVFFLVEREAAFAIYFNTAPTDRYGSGTWLHYIRPLPKYVGFPVLLLSLPAIFPLAKNRSGVAVFLPYLAYLFTHTVIYRFGLFASGGYQLFLLPMAPAFGLAAALGLEQLLAASQRFARPANANSWAIIRTSFLLICAILAVVAGLSTRPLPLDDEGVALQNATNWLSESDLDQTSVIASHVWFEYFYDGDSSGLTTPAADLQPGTIVVWDQHYSERVGLVYDDLISLPDCWQEAAQFGDGPVAAIFIKSARCPAD